MEKRYKSWTEFYQRYMLIYNAIIAFSLFPFVWIFLELERGSGGQNLLSGTILYIFDGVMASILGGALKWIHSHSKKRVKDVNASMDLGLKLGAYEKIKSQKFILFELIAVAAMAFTYLNSDYVFVIFYLFILFLFSIDRPRYEHIVKDLQLSKEEQSIIEQGGDLP